MAQLPPERLSFLRDLLRAHGPSGHEGPAAAVWRAEAETIRTSRSRRARLELRVGRPDGGPTRPPARPHRRDRADRLAHRGLRGVLRRQAARAAARWLGPRGARRPARRAAHRRRRASSRAWSASCRSTSRRRTGRRARASRRCGSTSGRATPRMPARSSAVGDTAVLVGEARELANGQLAGKALDNRTGAWIVLEAARRVAERGGGSVPVVACACAIEETLGDGARAAAHRVDPGDLDRRRRDPRLGRPRRPARHDRRAGARPRPDDHARSRSQPQADGRDRARRGRGGHRAAAGGAARAARSTYTDVDGALRALAGSAIALVSIPLRHMHSPAEVVLALRPRRGRRADRAALPLARRRRGLAR